MSELAFNSNQDVNKPCITKLITLGIGLWFILILVASISEIFAYSSGQPPVLVLMAVTMPVLLYAVLYYSNSVFRAWVLALDIRRLVLLHSWRMIGMGFIFLFFQDRLPALFAFPAGLGDAMAAIGAVILGITLYENREPVPRRRIWLWNAFGLIDFIIAVSLGVLTRTNEILYVEGQAGSDIMGSFPLVMIPGFFVPFYIIIHLVIFAQLKQR